MVFNTGAALLDAIVLAVVSKEQQGLMDIRSHRMSDRRWKYRNQPYIRCSGDFKKMGVWRCMICSLTAGTGDITK